MALLELAVSKESISNIPHLSFFLFVELTRKFATTSGSVHPKRKPRNTTAEQKLFQWRHTAIPVRRQEDDASTNQQRKQRVEIR